jgi:molybdopterin molybdotransferase
MLHVETPESFWLLIQKRFLPDVRREDIPLAQAHGRILATDVVGEEWIPGFDRSTVDGFAVRARDTFGCSEAIPAILSLQGEIAMGAGAEKTLEGEHCMGVPTGGAVPPGCDAVVMQEYTQDYGDGTIGILKPAAPGNNLIFRGDDVKPGQVVLPAGRRLTAQDIGALAAMGRTQVPVCRKPVVGILSTGDELVEVDATPGIGQVRDVNSALLRALVEESGGVALPFGILRDDESLLQEKLDEMLEKCDVVLLSGGSSVGAKDAACRVIERRGELLAHGIAMKPGKPTLLGCLDGKPVFGLPGHPVAAFFVSQLFVRPLLQHLMGRTVRPVRLSAVLTEPVSANHGRAQYGGVFLRERDGVLFAQPIHGKSGLITSLAGCDGYYCIPRDCEGVAQGDTIQVMIYQTEQEVR